MAVLAKILSLSVLTSALVTSLYWITLPAFSSVERFLQNGLGIDCLARGRAVAHKLLKQLSATCWIVALAAAPLSEALRRQCAAEAKATCKVCAT